MPWSGGWAAHAQRESDASAESLLEAQVVHLSKIAELRRSVATARSPLRTARGVVHGPMHGGALDDDDDSPSDIEDDVAGGGGAPHDVSSRSAAHSTSEAGSRGLASTRL